ncbi:MAG: RluA family pseudouridine synthase [Gammaproteobacteria bacterium]
MTAEAVRAAARNLVVTAEGANRRLDNYLGSVLRDVPRTLIYRIIRTGEVRVNGRRGKPAQKLAAGDTIRVPPLQHHGDGPFALPQERLTAFESTILYEDDRVIVVDKPTGMAVHGGSGLAYGLIDIARAARPASPRIDLVHRLDRPTSGCLMFAKDMPSLRALHDALAQQRVSKHYLALVAGRFPRQPTVVDVPLDVRHREAHERHTVASAVGVAAHTTFRLVRRFARCALVSAEPATGRTHQIRVHAAHLGHPLAGDTRYGDPMFNAELAALGLRRLFLHAHRLAFELGGHHCLEAPLPADLHSVLQALESRENFHDTTGQPDD